jgi:Na+/H+ antiporter NhaD/arsenite permease-like protein
MKVVVKILAIFLLVAGLVQLIDLSFYLMNQSDTYVFYLGIVSLAATFVAFGFLGLYAVRLIKEEEEKELKSTKKEEQL